MRMCKEFKPELVCGAKAGTSLSCPYLDIETGDDGVRTGRIVATDSCRLLAVPVELDDTDTMGSIPISAFVMARKVTAKHMAEIVIYCTEGVCSMTDGGTVPRPDNGRFPMWRSIVAPALFTQEISFDPSLLLGMAKAMGTAGRITLKIPASGGPLHLVGGGPTAESAILMPMS